MDLDLFGAMKHPTVEQSALKVVKLLPEISIYKIKFCVSSKYSFLILSYFAGQR